MQGFSLTVACMQASEQQRNPKHCKAATCRALCIKTIHSFTFHDQYKAYCAYAALQAFVSRARVDSFSLTADMMYVSSNAPRIARAVFEICLRRGWSSTAELALMLAKVRQHLHKGQ